MSLITRISEVAAGMDTAIFVSAPAILSCFPSVAVPEMGDVPISSIGCPQADKGGLYLNFTR